MIVGDEQRRGQYAEEFIYPHHFTIRLEALAGEAQVHPAGDPEGSGSTVPAHPAVGREPSATVEPTCRGTATTIRSRPSPRVNATRRAAAGPRAASGM